MDNVETIVRDVMETGAWNGKYGDNPMTEEATPVAAARHCIGKVYGRT